jgi:hypothetical protein
VEEITVEISVPDTRVKLYARNIKDRQHSVKLDHIYFEACHYYFCIVYEGLSTEWDIKSRFKEKFCTKGLKQKILIPERASVLYHSLICNLPDR